MWINYLLIMLCITRLCPKTNHPRAREVRSMTEPLFAHSAFDWHIHHLWSSQYGGHSYCVFRPMLWAYFETGYSMCDSAVSCQVPTCTTEWQHRFLGGGRGLSGKCIPTSLSGLGRRITFHKLMDFWNLAHWHVKWHLEKRTILK